MKNHPPVIPGPFIDPASEQVMGETVTTPGARSGVHTDRQNDDGRPRDQGACQVSDEELCALTLAHYERLANLAHEWNNQVPQAIKAWYARSESEPIEQPSRCRRAMEFLRSMVGMWDEAQSKSTQSIADEPWDITQARKIINGK